MKKIFKTAIKLIDLLEKDERIALANSKKEYLQPCDIWELEDKVKNQRSLKEYKDPFMGK